MTNIFVAIGYASPAPLIAVLTQWQELFRGTWFAHPGIAAAADPTALLLGAILSIVIVTLWQHQGAQFLRKATVASFLLVVALLVACAIFHYILRRPWPPNTTYWLESFWDLCLVAAMVDIFVLVTLAAMLVGASVRSSGTPG